MAIFQYNALTSAGRLMKGSIEAGSPQDAKNLLGQMGLNVNSVEKGKVERPKTAIGRGEFLLFNQQLASITRAGIPLERGLRELARDISSRSMRKLIEEIAADLEAGVGIEEAFGKREKHFPQLYGRILKAGVETGRLSEMLTSLNRHLELAGHTRRIIFEAISYPAVIFVLASIIITLVLRFIIPQFKAVLEEMVGGQLNPVTTGVFTLAQNIIPFWIGVAILVGAIILIFALLSSSAAGRRRKEAFLMAIPVIGRLYHHSVLSRMAQAMAILVGAGCDMAECLRLGAVATGSEKLVYDTERLAERVEQGTNVLEAGQESWMLPRLFLYSVQLGIQRNELQDNLHSLGEMYANQARAGQSRLQAVLLPVMLVVVGGFLGTAILAMFLPMIQVVTSLSAAG
ncbi:MAG: type II secretion system F family protein [Phycisphaerales bacterium]|nr:MAG: type II secretion system F family protein [Phycisphaerales bacterium]